MMRPWCASARHTCVRMGSTQAVPDASVVKAYIRQHPEALGMVALMAGNAEPQSDPEAERARQAAMAFGRGQVSEFTRERAPAASGQYRLTEYCLRAGPDLRRHRHLRRKPPAAR